MTKKIQGHRRSNPLPKTTRISLRENLRRGGGRRHSGWRPRCVATKSANADGVRIQECLRIRTFSLTLFGMIESGRLFRPPCKTQRDTLLGSEYKRARSSRIGSKLHVCEAKKRRALVDPGGKPPATRRTNAFRISTLSSIAMAITDVAIADVKSLSGRGSQPSASQLHTAFLMPKARARRLQR